MKKFVMTGAGNPSAHDGELNLDGHLVPSFPAAQAAVAH
jgi:hypothetical protein